MFLLNQKLGVTACLNKIFNCRREGGLFEVDVCLTSRQNRAELSSSLVGFMGGQMMSWCWANDL